MKDLKAAEEYIEQLEKDVYFYKDIFYKEVAVRFAKQKTEHTEEIQKLTKQL